MPEKGLISFIKNKLDNTVSPHDIRRMLTKAGFDEKKIDVAFTYIRQNHQDEYRELLTNVDFLPELKDKKSAVEEKEKQNDKAEAGSGSRGLFNGRLRRKDFILGFLFFFGIGYVILSFSALFISLISPALWRALLLAIEQDTNGLLLLTIPVLLAPITVMMISMITRRLHDIGIVGVLSFSFLAFFAPAIGGSEYGVIALHLALGLLFIILLSVRGNSKVNIYGQFPESRGSFFKRIFNQ